MSWIDKKGIMDCLKQLSDKTYQERVWTAASGPEISSYVEAMEQLYNGTGLSFAFEKGEQVFGKPIDDLLKEFRKILPTIHYMRPPMQLIEDPSMIPIRKAAAGILSLIEKQGDQKQ
jgi:hypothetical protein